MTLREQMRVNHPKDSCGSFERSCPGNWWRTLIRAGFLFTLAFGAPALSGQDSAAENPGWVAIQDVRFAEALALFRQQKDDGNESVRLGEAIALLHKQPITRDNTDEAVALLDQLIEEASDTSIALLATYLRARVVQLHPFEPDPAAALPLFLELAGSSPGTLIGQMAFLKASGLRLYAPGIPDDERPFLQIADESVFLTDPTVIRCQNLLLAEASQRFDFSDTFTLAHYSAAYDEGLAKPDLRANVLARIIILSSKLGDLDTARARAREFLAEFPRDIRVTVIGEFLAEWEEGSPLP